MITKIAELIKTEISTLEWVDHLGGVVRRGVVNVGGTDKVFPIYINDSADPCNPSVYLDFVPDSKKMSVVYFEDAGLEVVNSGCTFTDCTASLKLVCWANLIRINADYTDATLLKLDLIKNIPARLNNTDWITKILVTFAGEDIKSPAIFGGYSYDETMTQYLIYPYDYFALNYSVKFSFVNSCFEDVVLNPKVC
jgi:hypothetical protein